MKKGLLILFLLSAGITLSACLKPAVEPYRLPSPLQVKVEDNYLVWEPVDYCDGYSVNIDGKTYFTSENRYYVAALTEEREYDIKVTALGDDIYYSDSRPSKYTYKNVNVISSVFTKGLSYKLVSDGSGYEVSKGDAVLSGYLSIPNAVNGIPVVKVADCGFKDMTASKLNAVTFGSNIVEIGNEAFYRCRGISSVVFPSDLKRIGERAFYELGIKQRNKATTLFLNEGLEYVGKEAFYGCQYLEFLRIPSTVRYIGDRAFYSNYKVSVKGVIEANAIRADNVIYNPDNVDYIGDEFAVLSIPKSLRDNNGLYCSNGILYDSLNADSMTELVLRDDTKYIASRAFYGHKFLKQVTLPSDVKVVGKYAFADSGITKFKFKGIVSKIPDGMFADCQELTDVECSSTIIEIGEEAFKNCPKLKSSLLKKGLIKIGANAYNGSGVDVDYLPESLISMGDGCFANTNLDEVHFPQTLKILGDGIFEGCKSLTYVALNNEIDEIGLNVFKDCVSLNHMVIPDCITKIGEGAFYGCENLSDVKIGASVTGIDNYAFYGCNINYLEIPSSVKYIKSDAFADCVNLESIIFPHSSVILSSRSFYGCNNIKRIFYKGSVTQWGKLLQANTAMREWNKYDVYYYSSEQTDEIGKYWHYDDGGIAQIW